MSPWPGRKPVARSGHRRPGPPAPGTRQISARSRSPHRMAVQTGPSRTALIVRARTSMASQSARGLWTIPNEGSCHFEDRPPDQPRPRQNRYGGGQPVRLAATRLLWRPQLGHQHCDLSSCKAPRLGRAAANCSNLADLHQGRLPKGGMRVEVRVSPPEPAVRVFTTAGTCQGRLRRHS